MNNINKNIKIAVIGLGYVGLPLLIEMSKKFETIGFDKDKKKINNLKKNLDTTGELSFFELYQLKKIQLTSNLDDLKKSNVYIIAVPTPINKRKKPDLNLIKNATKSISKVLKRNDIIVFESTVYPGLTEEVCVPILEKHSGLKWKKDFFVGYSPERINPGDRAHNFTNVIKVVSGDTNKTLATISSIYSKVVKAGIFEASSIKVAEAAKAIENTQRDLNIALMNELSIIFKKMKLDINSVLEAAKTKWNFNDYSPGYVGGHCIGVDPYYLTYKSKQLNYNPKVILAGRKINDSMAKYSAKEIIKILKKKKFKSNKKILILGYTFKENCPDYRNTQIELMIDYINKYFSKIEIFDPYIKEKIKPNFLLKFPKKINFYECIIIAVPHDYFLKRHDQILKIAKKNCLYFDLKSKMKRVKNQWSL